MDKQQMNTCRLKVVAVAFGIGMAGAIWADLAVGYKGTDGLNVASGSADAGAVALGAEGRMIKTGEGALNVSGGAIKSVRDQRVTVVGGSVTITAGESAAVVAPAVCQRAAFWVDPTSAAATDGSVSRWYDVREADRANPKWVYAQPKWCTSEKIPAEKLNVNPTLETWEGLQGVYFGGKKSGQYMRFCKNGSEMSFNQSVRHLFFVHAMTNAIGCPVGCETSGQARLGPLLLTLSSGTETFSTSTKAMYARADICGPQSSAAFFIDGERLDPRTTNLKMGWQLWECDYHNFLPAVDNFYRCGFNEGSFFNGAQGGDYLGEALVFTNRLTVAERAAVERYLLDKWGLPKMRRTVPRQKGVEYLMAGGTSASVSVGADEVTAPVAFSGAGSVTKSGEGVLALGPSSAELAGDFTWNAGKMRLQGGRFPALTVAGGEKYVFDCYTGSSGPSASGDAVSGLTCEKTTGASDVVETTGYSWLRVNEVAEGVKKIKVGIPDYRYGSVLQLEGKPTAVASTPAAGGALRATFVNPDMELPVAITDAKFMRHEISSGTTYNGWTARSGSTMILCTQTPRSDNTWSQWLDGELPPYGTNILQLVQQKSVSTTVSVPKAGRYELNFIARSRYDHSNGEGKTGGGFAFADMVPAVRIGFGRTWDAAKNAIVETFQVHKKHFARFRCFIDVAEAGNWELGIMTVDNAYDACLFMDDFDMVYVPDEKTEVVQKVPNGGFDDIVRPASPSAANPPFRSRYCTLNQAVGWTFEINPEAKFAPAITNGIIGVVTDGAFISKGTNLMPYPTADNLTGGASLMFMSTGAVAKTERAFAMPAGMWSLRSKAMRWPTYIATRGWDGEVDKAFNDQAMTGTPKFRAKVIRADESVVDLGEFTAETQVMDTHTWPTSVTFDEGEQVTISIEQTVGSAFGVIDDLEFVQDGSGEENLLKDGDFANASSGWTQYDPPDRGATAYWNVSRASHDNYQAIYWGFSAYDTNNRIRFQNRGGIYQDITVPEPGLYRFKMHVRARADNICYANNPVKVWMVQGAVTNVLAQTPTLYTRHWVEVSYLANVPAAGTWRFYLEGRCRDEAIRAEQTSGQKADLDAHIDGVSFTRCHDTAAAAPTLPEHLKIELAKGATLLLDYTGKATCGAVRYNGTNYYGRISAATHPEFVTGLGELEAKPKGLLILVQ